MDRISGLSDDLLIKILLFVPTKVAVSTSHLSKRWEFLWMWLPKLECGDIWYSESECKRLRCFLNKNLPLHKVPVIESLSLHLHSRHFRPKDIKLWVVIAISHCVRELDIVYDYDRNKPNKFSSNLYTCKSLVILKLDGDFLVDVPRMVYLPALKTLKLRSVKYSNEESLQRLLSNCPILEDLSVDLRENDFADVPSLQSLSLYIPYDHDIDGIVIVTPSLEYLRLEDYNYKDHYYYLIENMPKLIEAHVGVALPNIKSIIGSITHVKRLTICSEAVYDEGFVFNQLEHLELCPCREQSSDLLIWLLKDSCNLQVLDVSMMEGHGAHVMISWYQPSTVPKCILSSLQTLNWSSYRGVLEERDLVVYSLQNALEFQNLR